MDISHMTDEWIEGGNYSQYDVTRLRNEVRKFQKLEKWAKRAMEWFDDNDSLSVNSKAYIELEEIMQR